MEPPELPELGEQQGQPEVREQLVLQELGAQQEQVARLAVLELQVRMDLQVLREPQAVLEQEEQPVQVVQPDQLAQQEVMAQQEVREQQEQMALGVRPEQRVQPEQTLAPPDQQDQRVQPAVQGLRVQRVIRVQRLLDRLAPQAQPELLDLRVQLEVRVQLEAPEQQEQQELPDRLAQRVQQEQAAA